jgi:hypothetical protein
LKEGEVEIYIKVLTNGPTEDAIEKDKNSKSPVVVGTTSKQEIRVYLHPVKNDPESAELLAKLCPISDWSLCAAIPEQRPAGEGVGVGAGAGGRVGVTYWSMP